MGHVEATKDLTATPDAVWTVISDPQTWDKWFTIHDGWLAEPPTTIELGSKLVEKIVMLGMANKLEWDIISFDMGQKLTMAGTGMAGVKVEFSFIVAPAESGSKFSVVGDFEGALIKGALGKAVEKDFGKQLDKSVSKLDALAAV
ncbi:carbon monoxide dehydrogenase subunit G [Mycobacterium sp. MAA66]|uniref:type II toxin-antitoxin system Rv0910 family toxin n=1 Tax=Mycobacterium sp. MAA66 TaxID=3156297 RepID=UPI0035161775